MSERKRFLERMRDFLADIEKDIVEAFGELIEEHCSWDPDECCLEPLTNIVETDDEIIITADLPYVKKENIDLHITEDMIDLKASLDRPVRFNQWGTVQRKTEFSKFHKHLKLPSTVDTKKVSAIFKSGILEIKLPKKITRIRIKIT
ncbi:MAG: Hsp20/alpha crystallin family protein [Candidatus Helarchaeota archaeon]